MNEFIKQLFSKLLSTIIFSAFLLFIFACTMTGEFPPRIESIKTQYQSLMELKKNSALMIKSATERMQKAQIEPVAATASLPQPEQNQNLQQEIREMRVEQLRMHNQVETLVQQNRELIKILTMPRSN